MVAPGRLSQDAGNRYRGVNEEGCDLRNRGWRRRPAGGKIALMAQHPHSSGKPRSCEDCYFRRNLLCALELDEPCATFRPDRPEGLVPPRQPVLLMRAPRWATQPR
jgi:hypothetical protein